MIKHLLESVEIEAIPDVLLVNLAKELMILKITEPTDPSITLLRTIRLCFGHSSHDGYYKNNENQLQIRFNTSLTSKLKRSINIE